MEKIDQLITWYEENADRMDDNYIVVNLKTINNLYDAMGYLEEKMFVDKIIATFTEIIEVQREVIEDIKLQLETPRAYAVDNKNNYLGFSKTDVIGFSGNNTRTVSFESFKNDGEIQDAFSAHCLYDGKSSYTTNDYSSRIKNLWKTYYNEYISGTLNRNFYPNVEKIKDDSPLFNVYNHIKELDGYITEKIAKSEGNRNWANARAAFNRFSKFKKKVEE